MMSKRSDRTFDGATIEDCCVHQVAAGQNSDRLAVAHEKRVALDGSHPPAGVGDRILRIDEHSGMQEDVANPRPKQGREARPLLLARDSVELAGDVEVEKRREPWI